MRCYISLGQGEGEDYIFCVKYVSGSTHSRRECYIAPRAGRIEWTSRLSLTSLTTIVTNVFVLSTMLHNSKSSGTLYNFVFHISCSTCTSSVPYIYVALHLSVYYIYTCYIYTLLSQCIYMYPIPFSTPSQDDPLPST